MHFQNVQSISYQYFERLTVKFKILTPLFSTFNILIHISQNVHNREHTVFYSSNFAKNFSVLILLGLLFRFSKYKQSLSFVIIFTPEEQDRLA